MLQVNNGLILLPFGIYLMIKKPWLDRAQLYILIIANLMVLAIIVDSFILQIVFIILLGFQEGFVLSLAKHYKPSQQQIKQHKYIFWLLTINFQEVIFLVFVSSIWILMRVYTHLSPLIPQQLSEQYVTFDYYMKYVLHGWNCTFFEYTFFSGLWFGYLILSWSAIVFLRQYQDNQFNDNKYREVLLTYKIIPDVVLVGVWFSYNLIAYVSADSVWECKQYWQKGKYIHYWMYFCIPLTTYLFFFKKNNEQFQVNNQTDLNESLNLSPILPKNKPIQQ